MIVMDAVATVMDVNGVMVLVIVVMGAEVLVMGSAVSVAVVVAFDDNLSDGGAVDVVMVLALMMLKVHVGSSGCRDAVVL